MQSPQSALLLTLMLRQSEAKMAVCNVDYSSSAFISTMMFHLVMQVLHLRVSGIAYACLLKGGKMSLVGIRSAVSTQLLRFTYAMMVTPGTSETFLPSYSAGRKG